MDTFWQNSVVLVRSSDPGEQSFGTGFVIYKDEQATYVLTCAHVVRAVGGPSKIEVNGIQAWVVASSPEEGADLAVLRIEGLFALPSLPLSVEKDESFSTVGFQQTGKQIINRVLHGTLGKQVWVHIAGQATDPIQAWDLEITDKDPLQEGYSGSPVINEHNHVIGVINTLRGDGARGMAIAIEAVAKIWLEMPRSLFIQGVKRLLTLTGHNGPVYNMAWSPDGKMLASASRDSTVKLWDATHGMLFHTLAGHTEAVYSIAWSPDGKMLASASWDRTARIWNVTSRSLLHTLTNKVPVTEVAWSPNGEMLASVSTFNVRFERHQTVQIWDAIQGTLLYTIVGVKAAWSPDGSLLATVLQNKKVQIWNAPYGTLLHTLTNKGPTRVAWSPDGKILASYENSLYDNEPVKLWDATRGTLLRTLTGHAKSVSYVAWSPDGKVLATSSGDHTVRLWDTTHGTLLHTLTGDILFHTLTGDMLEDVAKVAWSPDSKVLAISTRNNKVRLWFTDTWCSAGVLTNLEDFSYEHYIAWHPSLPLFATVGQSASEMIIWTLQL